MREIFIIVFKLLLETGVFFCENGLLILMELKVQNACLKKDQSKYHKKIHKLFELFLRAKSFCVPKKGNWLYDCEFYLLFFNHWTVFDVRCIANKFKKSHFFTLAHKSAGAAFYVINHYSEGDNKELRLFNKCYRCYRRIHSFGGYNRITHKYMYLR